MNRIQLAAVAWVAAILPAAAQDVTVTNAIKPSDPLFCKFDQGRVQQVEQSTSIAEVRSMLGCTGRQVSSFDLLGQKTEIFEFTDTRQRLQVTVRNNKIVSRTFRNL